MNMRNEDFNEKQHRELTELENELRSFGAPYSGEPDSRYFTNFRVRVMERIREEEAAKATPWYGRTLGWIEEHLLISSLSTAAVLVAVWAALMMQPLEPARHQMAQASKPTPQVQQAPQIREQHDVAVAQPVKSEEPKQIVHVSHVAKSAPDMAAAYVPVATADDVGPVSLADLSAPELRSVLNTLETE